MHCRSVQQAEGCYNHENTLHSSPTVAFETIKDRIVSAYSNQQIIVQYADSAALFGMFDLKVEFTNHHPLRNSPPTLLN
jgi:hypothetical protein